MIIKSQASYNHRSPPSLYIIISMLVFHPNNHLALTPQHDQKLQAAFVVTNPSPNTSAPFRIRCNRPELFKVRPHVGVLAPQQQLQVTVTSQHASSPQLTAQLATSLKFKIEYVSIRDPPQDLSVALQAIDDRSKLTHTLYLNEQDAQEGNSNDSSRTVRDEKEEVGLERFTPEELNEEERFEYLKQEIDRTEKIRSEVIMAGRPKQRNWILTVAVLLLMVAVGNATGRAIGIGVSSNKNAKKREYKYWGLEKLWAGQETAHPNWAFWR